MSTLSPAAAKAATRNSDHRWWILVVVSLAQLMEILDTTIVNIALPSAQADLGIADGQRQWVVTAYALAFGGLLLLGGRIGDLLGRRRTFLIALVAFGLASALGGAAPSFGVLVTARTLQGIAAALLAPAALSTLITTFNDPRERGRAFGIFATVAVGGSAVGLVMGGLLTEYLSWRWTMYVNVVFAAVAFLGALVFLRSDRPTERARIDLAGTALVTAGLFGLVFGFSHAESAGWSSGVTVTSLALGAVLLTAFVIVEQRVHLPLLPLRVITDRARAAAFAAVAISGFAMFGLFLFLTYYLQTVLGYSPVRSGLAFLPMIAFIIISANLSNTLTLPRFGPKVVITVGMMLGSLALANLSRLNVDSSYAANVLPSLVAMGLGMGMIVAPSMNIATSGVQPTDAGVASALVNTMQQIGGSVGTAVLSTIAATVTKAFATEHSSNGAGLAAQAATHGYTIAFAVSAGAFAAGALMSILLFPSRTQLHGTDQRAATSTSPAKPSAPHVSSAAA